MKEHTPYQIIFGRQPDFLVEYKYMKESANGINLFQGIRSDFCYDYMYNIDVGCQNVIMMWPEFLDRNLTVIKNKKTPIKDKGLAYMWVINEPSHYLEKNNIRCPVRVRKLLSQ